MNPFEQMTDDQRAKYRDIWRKLMVSWEKFQEIEARNPPWAHLEKRDGKIIFDRWKKL